MERQRINQLLLCRDKQLLWYFFLNKTNERPNIQGRTSTTMQQLLSSYSYLNVAMSSPNVAVNSFRNFDIYKKCGLQLHLSHTPGLALPL